MLVTAGTALLDEIAEEEKMCEFCDDTCSST